MVLKVDVVADFVLKRVVDERFQLLMVLALSALPVEVVALLDVVKATKARFKVTRQLAYAGTVAQRQVVKCNMPKLYVDYSTKK